MTDVVALVRRWAEDWLGAADPAACDELLHPDYGLAIGGRLLGGPDGGGRDAYVRATVEGLLQPFPGVRLTVHELVASGDRAAGVMTWSGTTPDGRAASWRVVALFRAQDGRLVSGHAEEDYLARRRQLRAGTTDAVPAAAADPWGVALADPDAGAEAVVRAWLDAFALEGVTLDDDGSDDHPRIDDGRTEVLELFSVGPRVAFHAVRWGRYAGGLDGVAAETDDVATDADGGQEVALHVAGIVEVRDGGVVSGSVVRDRLGLRWATRDGSGAGRSSS